MKAEKKPSAQQLRQELADIEGRESHIWWVALFIGWILGTGLTALLAPAALWGSGTLRVEGHYQSRVLLYGFVVLVVLFNLYMLEQRRLAQTLRRQAMQQLLRANAAEAVAQIDVLTDTFNRRFLHRLLEKETSRAERNHSSLVLMMIDIDDFKTVNSRFGHLMGDSLLREIAQILKNTFRTSDFVIRYGGDEFIAVMTETDDGQAETAEVRLHANVESWNQRALLPGWQLRVSCGSAEYRDGMTIDELLAEADENMYRQKRTARAHTTPA